MSKIREKLTADGRGKWDLPPFFVATLSEAVLLIGGNYGKKRGCKVSIGYKEVCY